MLKRYSAKVVTAAVSPIGEFALRFLRTMVLSRLLAPDDLGAATALFAILVSCEMMSDFGLDSFVMVNNGENRAEAVAAAQRIALVRAALIALVIALFAPVLARIFAIPGQEANIQWLGLVSFIKSLKNWRVIQVQADARYGPQTITNLGSNAAAFVAAALAALYFRDARAMLISLLAEASVYALLSYAVLARYRAAGATKAVVVAALKYGLPLAVNGLALLFLSQLDRIIIANLFGLTMLALYALVWSLAIAPTAPIVLATSSLCWPLLTRQTADPSATRNAPFTVLMSQFILGAAYAMAIATFLDMLVPLVFGSRYTVTPGVQAAAAGIAFLRVCRAAPNTILLASGQTGVLTLGNMGVVAGPVLGFGLAWWLMRLDALMAGMMIGDLLSLAMLLFFIRNRLPKVAMLKQLGLLTLPVCVTALAPCYGDGLDWRARLALLLAGGLVLVWQSLMLYQSHLRALLPAFLEPAAPALSPQPSEG